MPTEKTWNENILRLTTEIREKNPELLTFLNEMPETLPDKEKPSLHLKALEAYYDSLVALQQGYEDKHANNVVIPSPIPDPFAEPVPEVLDAYPNIMLDVNDMRLSYNDVGTASIPIVFLHGFPFDKSMWQAQLTCLKNTQRAIAYDIRGFGKSTGEKTHLSIPLFATDLIAFMDELKIEKAILCGLSMGGFIALNAIKRFPERFEALILCDTQCIADTPEVKKNRLTAIQQINRDGAATFNEKFVKSIFHPDSLTDKTALVEGLRQVIFANTKDIITAGLTALAERSETCSTLAAIRVPTLLICGRADKVTPLSESEFMHAHIEGAHLKIIENAGHVSNLEQPAAFNAHIMEFLAPIDTNKYVEPNSEPLCPKVEV